MKRGRNQRRRQGPNPNRALDSNGPDVRIRGTANQIYDKYQALARDAQSAGDRVKAENYLQHAEHYFRVIRASQPNQVMSQDNDAENDGDQDGDHDQSENNGQENRRADNNRSDRNQRNDRRPRPHREDEASNRNSDEDVQSDDDTHASNGAASSASSDSDSDNEAEEAPKPRRKRRPRVSREEAAVSEDGASKGEVVAS